MKSILYTIVLALTAGCTVSHASEPNFTLTTPVPAEGKNKMAYLVNRETGDKIDSVLVTDTSLKFSGTVTDPYYARILIGDKRGPSVIVEPGYITIDDDGRCSSTPLNREIQKYVERYNATAKRLETVTDDSIRAAVIAGFEAASDSTMKANIDNPFGWLLFMDKASECTSMSQLDKLLSQYPRFRTNKGIADIASNLRKAEQTAPGKKFTDFSIDYNGTVSRLSDYAGKGNWLLVDFWASWCGPCRRAMPLLKELYSQYHDKGLDILGVAVWDEPADSERAARQLQLLWPQIINAQKIPTDIYGIYGIPHLMLIAPDGTIAARGLEGESLRTAIEQALTPSTATGQ